MHRNAGYCFIDFQSPQAAAKALSLNGSMIPNTSRPFKLNWASGGGLADRRYVLQGPFQFANADHNSSDDRGPEFSIFVGDLGPEVNEYVLVSLFQSRFPSCKSAKIMTDPISGMSRGYGFVRFGEEADQQRALTEMQGVYCGNRPMRISTATPKNKSGGGGPGGMPMQGNMGGGGGHGGGELPLHICTLNNADSMFSSRHVRHGCSPSCYRLLRCSAANEPVHGSQQHNCLCWRSFRICYRG